MWNEEEEGYLIRTSDNSKWKHLSHLLWGIMSWLYLILVLLKPDVPYFENIVDPDHLSSAEAIWSGSTLFSTLIENTFTTGMLQVTKIRIGEECST